MPAKRYVVTLTPAQRAWLETLTRAGKRSARAITRARVLLLTDQGDGRPGWEDRRVAEALGCGHRTVERVRERFVTEGLDAALTTKARARAPRERVLDVEAEGKLIALANSAAPDGRRAWTLRMLANKLIALEVVESISHETVRQALKKNPLQPHAEPQPCLPGGPSVEFVAPTDVLDGYHPPHDGIPLSADQKMTAD